MAIANTQRGSENNVSSAIPRDDVSKHNRSNALALQKADGVVGEGNNPGVPAEA